MKKKASKKFWRGIRRHWFNYLVLGVVVSLVLGFTLFPFVLVMCG